MARILAVDDEPLVRKAVARLMTRLGHTVVEAADGETALRLAQEEPLDAALVDYDMPGGPDGLAVLSRLRELSPRCVRVLMTGRTDFPVIVHAVNEGEIYRVLPKPFRATQLEDLLGHVVGAARRYAAVETAERDATRVIRLFEELLEGDRARLAVQPIVRADAPERVVAVECLLRSTHPLLPTPHAILRAVERGNRVPELGALVNRLAAGWAERLPSDVLVFVNVHPAQLADPDVVARFAPLLPHAERVVLEITERADLRAIDGWDMAVAELSARGFRFAVDDLGSGYAGLALLADLRPAFVKLDATIVRDVHVHPHKQRLVDLLARFVDATGGQLVAEGVETQAEVDAVRRAGAHLVQGYHIARPTFLWPPE